MFKEAFDSACNRMNKRNTPEKIISVILSLIVGLCLAISFYTFIDVVPATFDDYVPLNEKLLSVEENPSSVLEGDGVFTIKDESIEYTVENEQCKMTGKYDSNYKLIGKQQKDKSLSVFRAIVCCIMVMILFALLCYLACFVLLLPILVIVYLVIALVKKYKDSKEKRFMSAGDEHNDDEGRDKEPSDNDVEGAEAESSPDDVEGAEDESSSDN